MNRIQDPSDLLVAPHHHLHHELDLVLEGEGIFSVGTRKIDVRPGSLVYLARGVHHWRRSHARRPLYLCNTILDDEAMCQLLSARPGGGMGEWPWWSYWTGAELQAGPGRTLVNRLVRRSLQGPANLSRTDLGRLLSSLVPLLETHGLSSGSRIDLHNLAWRVRQDPEQPLDLEVEAARLGVSRWWLSRSFRRRFGISLWEHRDFARVNRAIIRLLDSAAPIGVIAREIGFSTVGEFIRVFRRVTGLTPRAFRQRHRAFNGNRFRRPGCR